MEKILKYNEIIKKVLCEIKKLFPRDSPVELQTIFDDPNGHYLLLMVGWENDNLREYAPVVHIDLKSNGKVYVQHDGTDLKVALLLVEQGIPQSSIVIAYRSVIQRKFFEGFALT